MTNGDTSLNALPHSQSQSQHAVAQHLGRPTQQLGWQHVDPQQPQQHSTVSPWSTTERQQAHQRQAQLHLTADPWSAAAEPAQLAAATALARAQAEPVTISAGQQSCASAPVRSSERQKALEGQSRANFHGRSANGPYVPSGAGHGAPRSRQSSASPHGLRSRDGASVVTGSWAAVNGSAAAAGGAAVAQTRGTGMSQVNSIGCCREAGALGAEPVAPPPAIVASPLVSPAASVEAHGDEVLRQSVPSRERQRQSDGPIHLRLYQEKDDRRRRLEEARLRHLEQEEEEIRVAAQRALGRTASPGRASSPSPLPGTVPGRTLPPGAQTPPHKRPPLPERSSSTGALGRRRAPMPSGGVATSANAGGTPMLQAPAAKAAFAPCTGEVEVALPASSSLATPQVSVYTSVDASSVYAASVTSEPGIPSSIVCEESLYNPGYASTGLPSEAPSPAGGHRHTSQPEDTNTVHDLRQLVSTQQQRIDFLEHMHQQALRQLQKCRDELAKEQQQRLREADKALKLEQLISEMQGQRFAGDSRMQQRSEEWFRRSRAILDTD